MANTRKVLTIECHRVLAVCGNVRAFSSRSSLPDGFRSPQAVADAVAAALAAENDARSDANRRKSQTPADPNQPPKLERRHLEGDVITNQNVTVQQLMYPKNTPDWQLIKPEHFERVPTPKGWKAGLEKLQERIGVKFQDMTLLKSALTHHGCLPLNPVPEDVPVVRLSNRSLEFLGDSLLGAAAAGYVYQMLPRHQEGQLSRAKSALVNNDTLSKISADLSITDLLLWPPGFSQFSTALTCRTRSSGANPVSGRGETQATQMHLRSATDKVAEEAKRLREELHELEPEVAVLKYRSGHGPDGDPRLKQAVVQAGARLCC
ncbi:hypothetical protein PPTG_06314 [Phytophthora nicotianae INRA-310]|uniref:RNase III domain-containing protein n=1 Tax=Phytophthora nicotianae (strain INRA-310) TaxID=761204 RepID=W2QSY5_PHYN3|nr:hypothetical protein PPTG_06314 [Phytophthora nicotianae INRA-310]ETN16086.1 hypothetical protein PPTG_06314 [Phytophthora nicotianae INRA-310]